MVPEKLNILVVRHEECSSLGLLGSALKNNTDTFRYLDTPQGEVLTDSISNYSHIVVLGGPVSAYEDECYPYLKYEFKLLKEAIEQQIPILGICLGSQILATVLGARVYRGEVGREAGWCEVELTDEALIDPLFQQFPASFKVFQSHQDTFDIPADCAHIAISSKYPNQAFRYQDYVWAIQFHLEIDDKVLEACSEIIRQELQESQITNTTIEKLLKEARAHASAVAPLAENLMLQFLKIKSKSVSLVTGLT